MSFDGNNKWQSQRIKKQFLNKKLHSGRTEKHRKTNSIKKFNYSHIRRTYSKRSRRVADKIYMDKYCNNYANLNSDYYDDLHIHLYNDYFDDSYASDYRCYNNNNNYDNYFSCNMNPKRINCSQKQKTNASNTDDPSYMIESSNYIHTLTNMKKNTNKSKSKAKRSCVTMIAEECNKYEYTKEILMNNSYDLKDEIETLQSVYTGDELTIKRQDDTLHVVYTTKLEESSEIIVDVAVKNKCSISITNGKNTKKIIPINILSKIEKILMNKYEEEIDSMPIFQCISFCNDELLKDERFNIPTELKEPNNNYIKKLNHTRNNEFCHSPVWTMQITYDISVMLDTNSDSADCLYIYKQTLFHAASDLIQYIDIANRAQIINELIAMTDKYIFADPYHYSYSYHKQIELKIFDLFQELMPLHLTKTFIDELNVPLLQKSYIFYTMFVERYKHQLSFKEYNIASSKFHLNNVMFDQLKFDTNSYIILNFDESKLLLFGYFEKYFGFRLSDIVLLCTHFYFKPVSEVTNSLFNQRRCCIKSKNKRTIITGQPTLGCKNITLRSKWSAGIHSFSIKIIKTKSKCIEIGITNRPTQLLCSREYWNYNLMYSLYMVKKLKGRTNERGLCLYSFKHEVDLKPIVMQKNMIITMVINYDEGSLSFYKNGVRIPKAIITKIHRNCTYYPALIFTHANDQFEYMVNE